MGYVMDIRGNWANASLSFRTWGPSYIAPSQNLSDGTELASTDVLTNLRQTYLD